MAEQSFKHHARFDPPFHFFLIPILLFDFGLAIYITVHQWPAHPRPHLWWIVMSFAWLFAAFTLRAYALKNQDRTIRLEERLRMASLLPPAELAASHALTTKQYVALRFASDAELAGLVQKTLSGNLVPKAIKASIVTWRPDHDRI